MINSSIAGFTSTTFRSKHCEFDRDRDCALFREWEWVLKGAYNYRAKKKSALSSSRAIIFHKRAIRTPVSASVACERVFRLSDFYGMKFCKTPLNVNACVRSGEGNSCGKYISARGDTVSRYFNDTAGLAAVKSHLAPRNTMSAVLNARNASISMAIGNG